MQIDKLDITLLQEMMGTEATREEAYAMRGILAREYVVDTDEVSEAKWTQYLAEAVAIVAEERDEG